MNYPLGYNTWSKEEIAAASKVLKSGYFTMGQEVLNFEKNFARKFGAKYSVMVNSGSSANLLMLNLLKNLDGIIKKKN